MKKHFTRLLALTLAILALLPLIVACSNKSGRNEEENVSTLSPEVTRAELVYTLIESRGYNEDEAWEEQPCPFSDIEGHEYERHIIIASCFGILDASEEKFYPDEAATREFAATAVAKCLGFIPGESIECDDLSDILSPEYAKLATDLGFFSLNEEKFLPQMALSSAELEGILKIAEETFSSVLDSVEENTNLHYQDGVIVLTEEECSEITIDGIFLYLPLTEKTKSLKEGDILALSDGSAYRLTSVTMADDGIEAQCELPQIQEVYRYIRSSGKAYADVDNMTLGNGVSATAMNSRITGEGGKDDFGDFLPVFKFTKDLASDVKLNIVIDWNLISAQYYYDIDMKKATPYINNAYYSITTNIDGAVIVSVDNDDKTFKVNNANIPGKIKLCTVPLIGNLAFGACADIYVILSAEGAASLSFNIVGDSGVQILHNMPRMIFTQKLSLTGLSLAGEFKAGLNVDIHGDLAKWPLLRFCVDNGYSFKGSAELKDIDPFLFCVDGAIAPYCEVTLMKDTVIAKWCKCSATYTIMENNSKNPDRKGIHCENLINFVDECTYKEDESGETLPSDPLQTEPLPPENPTEDDLPPPQKGTCHVVLRVYHSDYSNENHCNADLHKPIDYNEVVLGLFNEDKSYGELVHYHFSYANNPNYGLPKKETTGIPSFHASYGTALTFVYKNVPLIDGESLYIYKRVVGYRFMDIMSMVEPYGRQEKIYLSIDKSYDGKTIYIDLGLDCQQITLGGECKHLEARRELLDPILPEGW